jgi:hypothetical protein
VLAAGKGPACKLSVASVEDRGEGEGCTGSLSEMQEVADGGYRAQIILVCSSTHPLIRYICVGCGYRQDTRPTVSPMNNRSPDAKKPPPG